MGRSAIEEEEEEEEEAKKQERQPIRTYMYQYAGQCPQLILP
jgi:uncharacterized protein YlaI